MAQDQKIEIDSHSQTATTGREWDGIRELNTPLPRWWLWTFYATIVWAFGYWIVYPAIPLISDYSHGAFGWNSRTAVVQDLGDLKNQRAGMDERLAKASLADIKNDPQMFSFAQAKGAAAFATNCSPCHGAGAQGSKGYPNLNADRWIWGGKLENILQTITHGVRWDGDPDTRVGLMPAFGREGVLKADEVSDVADYVRSMSGFDVEKTAHLDKGKAIFAANCVACHGDDGKGNQEIGAPDLTTKVWLYGPEREAIVQRVNIGGGGVMSAWSGRLDEATIKALAIFVHSRGGGQ
jgi:cytochrome c oxidase cbb3-type subunit III